MASVDACFSPELVAKVRALIKTGTDTGERVSAWEAIQRELLDAKVAWRTQVAPDQVGVHPLNRSRLGVSGSESHHLGAQILKSGWSWKKASDATAVEVPPAPDDLEARAVNQQLVELSGGVHSAAAAAAFALHRRRPHE